MWFGRKFHDAIEKRVRSEVERQLDKQLPGIIRGMLADKFAKEPDRELSKIGFNWALALAIKKHWPDIPDYEAVRWLREYVGVPHGHPDYVWTARAADELAAEYVAEFGEPA